MAILQWVGVFLTSKFTRTGSSNGWGHWTPNLGLSTKREQAIILILQEHVRELWKLCDSILRDAETIEQQIDNFEAENEHLRDLVRELKVERGEHVCELFAQVQVIEDEIGDLGRAWGRKATGDFLEGLHVLVNDLFKESWKKYVTEEVSVQLRNAIQYMAKDVNATRAQGQEAKEDYETPNERVEHLRTEIAHINKTSNKLNEKIDRLREVGKTKTEQASQLMRQIKILENHQFAHANDIKIVHEESNHLWDRVDSLKEKGSPNENLAQYSGIAPINRKKRRQGGSKSKWAIYAQALLEVYIAD